MGLEGRNAINVRSVKGAIFVAGEFGTLNEFTAAWTTGNNVLGILEGVGGISLYIRDILACTHSHYGSSLVFDSDPIRLVQRVCQEVEQRYSLEGHPPIAEDVHAIIACYLEKESGACLDRTPTTPIGV
jgi:predicted Rossmann-fold nucleotide-binding protein